MKFYAACHGASPEGEPGDTPIGDHYSESGMKNLPTDKDPRFRGCVPGDPSSYAHLSEELQQEFMEKRMNEDRMFFMKAFS
jgi:hypothetical protein